MIPHRFLHVANGTSTTQLIEAAGISGTLSIWADILYEGPVPGGMSDEDLVEIRARFLSGAADDLRQWRAAIADHDSYDELILWYEHDLFDQLNLVQVLSWIRDRVPTDKLVTLICVGSFPGHPNFKGLGELTAVELASLLQSRTPVTDAQHSLAQRAWRAFREPTPEGLDRLRREDTTALPYLSAALTRLLQEYPWTTDGLSRSERRLAELTAAGITLHEALPRMHQGEDAYYLTDLSLARMVAALSSASSPAFPAQDRADARVVDRWIGGVHLQPGGADWRWDPTRGRIVAPLV